MNELTLDNCWYASSRAVDKLAGGLSSDLDRLCKHALGMVQAGDIPTAIACLRWIKVWFEASPVNDKTTAIAVEFYKNGCGLSRNSVSDNYAQHKYTPIYDDENFYYGNTLADTLLASLSYLLRAGLHDKIKN